MLIDLFYMHKFSRWPAAAGMVTVQGVLFIVNDGASRFVCFAELAIPSARDHLEPGLTDSITQYAAA